MYRYLGTGLAGMSMRGVAPRKWHSEFFQGFWKSGSEYFPERPPSAVRLAGSLHDCAVLSKLIACPHLPFRT